MKRVLWTLLSLLCFAAGLPSFAQSATTHTVVYSFSGGTKDGSSPYGPVVQAPDGNLYGMTPVGGANNGGVIYRVSLEGVETVLYSFPAANGSLGGLTLGSDGKLYGFSSGGSYSFGQFFSLTLNGTFSSLYIFTGATDGSGPQGPPVEGSDGSFYGAAQGGGIGYGTVFKITSSGIFTLLHQFNGVQDSGSPESGLIEGSDGNFYGTVNNSDTGNFNTLGGVYQVTPDGTFTPLHLFSGGTDGSNPDGALVEGTDGAFYGTTHNGGLSTADGGEGDGTIFKITSAGVLTTLYSFTGVADGGHPEGTLALAPDGNFYGTSTASGNGTFFRLTPSGTFTVMHTFTGYADGSQPLSGPVEGFDGNLYGTTEAGGDFLLGTVYKITPATPLAPAVQLTASASSVSPGVSFTLNWSVLNAESNSARLCVAAVQGGSGAAGVWSGVQTGTVSGTAYSGSATITPIGSGSFVYALTCGGSETGFVTVTVPPLAITTTSLPNATTGTNYQQTLQEVSGLSPYTWSVIGGALPAGLSLDSSTGTLAGTATLVGTYNFAVQVSDSEMPVAVAVAKLSLTVVSATPTIVATPSTMTTKAGSTSNTTLTVSGFSSSSVSFACSGLPAESTCTFGTLNATSAVGTAALQISTTAAFTASALRSTEQHPATRLAWLFPGGVLLLASVRRMRRRVVSCGSLLVLAVCVGLASLSGCSSSPSPQSPAQTAQGTPAGTSSVTVIATSGSQTVSTTLTLTVQ